MNNQLSRQEIEQWALSLDAEQAPFSSQVQAENAFFVSQLQSSEGEDVSEIRKNVEEEFTENNHQSERWKRISWGSIAAGIGVNLATGGTVGIAALVGGFAGMMYSSSVSSKKAIKAHEREHFKVQLDDVANDIIKKKGNL